MTTWTQLWASQVGQVLLAFLRVAAATTVACWTQAGMPIRDLVGGDLLDWVELGLQAGFALVLANYLAPWEPRYGRRAKRRVTGE